MEFCQVKLEGHTHSSTIYISGLLADLAATRAEAMVGTLREGISIVRVDLRGVELVDPTAFVRLARSLSRWRDLKGGRVMIQFPERSSRATRSSSSSTTSQVSRTVCSLPVRPRLTLHTPHMSHTPTLEIPRTNVIVGAARFGATP